MDALSSMSFHEKRKVHAELMAKTGSKRGIEEVPAARGKLLRGDK